VVGADGSAKDAKLAQVDLAANTDKYYVLQMFTDGVGSASHYVYCRWGRTGTSGQSKLEGPSSLEAANKAFEKLYKEKTGLGWAAKNVGGPQPKV
jgi:predicted DNA-binding WGR domain protein